MKRKNLKKEEGLSLKDLDMFKPKAKTRWGGWVYSPLFLTLTYYPTIYEIDLEEINSSAEMLDWIFKLWNKTWVQSKPKIISDLISAFQDLLAPQKNYCSFGNDKKANPKEILETI
ncbi:hypothetical protein A2Z67_00955 [Candidatus Woesebacteria bacterium RBG_13_36_22]|uniref:Uncharacterized protein n=1 Tax=Candidatus Woesebacteria bacterium RBG_13_36_22 TaxID=1802478 RepID=A0A1F7WZI1_9BACT|nr:MAG: hypothetical protein A2Z67_00955 [Candidatus Woesebacteria bacterium RBG_13_36_22]